MIAEIQVAPSPPGTAEDPHAHVEAAIAVIQASGLRYEVGALGTTLEGDADAVWGHCVGYPGYQQPAGFRRYLLHNRLPVHRWFAAYDASVREVGNALEVRRRHAGFAARTQQLDDLDLQAAFLAEFGHDGT